MPEDVLLAGFVSYPKAEGTRVERELPDHMALPVGRTPSGGYALYAETEEQEEVLEDGPFFLRRGDVEPIEE